MIHINSLDYLYVGYFFAVVIHIASMLVHTFGVLRLQFKEARVNNGLKSLRQRMLVWGLTLEIISLVTVFVLLARYVIDGDAARYSIVTLIIIHSLGTLSNAVNWRHIYQEQFSEESKSLHEKMSKIEKEV